MILLNPFSQAWTNMVLTVLNQIQILPDPTFTALQPAVFPCISQLTCHVTDIRVRQAVREWLGRVGRVYDIIVQKTHTEEIQQQGLESACQSDSIFPTTSPTDTVSQKTINCSLTNRTGAILDTKVVSR